MIFAIADAQVNHPGRSTASRHLLARIAGVKLALQ
jgi:hypothetical protein